MQLSASYASSMAWVDQQVGQMRGGSASMSLAASLGAGIPGLNGGLPGFGASPFGNLSGLGGIPGVGGCGCGNQLGGSPFGGSPFGGLGGFQPAGLGALGGGVPNFGALGNNFGPGAFGGGAPGVGGPGFGAPGIGGPGFGAPGAGGPQNAFQAGFQQGQKAAKMQKLMRKMRKLMAQMQSLGGGMPGMNPGFGTPGFGGPGFGGPTGVVAGQVNGVPFRGLV